MGKIKIMSSKILQYNMIWTKSTCDHYCNTEPDMIRSEDTDYAYVNIYSREISSFQNAQVNVAAYVHDYILSYINADLQGIYKEHLLTKTSVPLKLNRWSV